MRFGTAALTIASLGLWIGEPAEAETITFSGQGSVGDVRGTAPRNAAAAVDNPFRFTFTFDTATLTLLEEDDQDAFYDLPVSGFVASIGDYGFALSAERGFEPVLAVSRAFAFFDQPFSEPVLITTFNFASVRNAGTSATTPFATGTGAYGALAISAFFRQRPGASGLGVDQLRDPAGADRLEFSYATRDPATRQTGFLQGTYRGSFAGTAAVPEPAGWVVLVVGFGVLGASLRSRRRAVSSA